MANNLTTSKANYSIGSSDYLNNFYKPNYTITSNQNTAVIAFFENITQDYESAKILASSVVYTSIAQGVDPMTVIDQLKNMDGENRNKFISMFLNFNRIGTSQLGIHTTSKYNKYIQRMINPPPTSYADGSSPEKAANNARSIQKLTGTKQSDYYWIRGYNNSPMQVYCDMTGSESGSTLGGWMRFDNNLVMRYSGSSISQEYKGYFFTATGGYTINNPGNGIMRGVVWDLGTNLKFSGVRITQIKFNCVNGQDGYQTYDGPSPDWGGGLPTNEQVINFIQEEISLGGNFSSYGWSVGNGYATTNDLIRLYKKANVSEWPPQFSGLVTLSSSAFFQYDSTSLVNGRYLYYYESDSTTEYNNLLEYKIWLR